MSASLDLRARELATAVVDRLPSRGPVALADPPPGSELAPVMGEPGLPVFGNTLAFMQRNLEFCRENHERHGPVFWTNALGTRLLVVLGPDNIETVLQNRDKAFSNEEGWGYFIGPFFDRGVMLMDFAEHRAHRRIMQAAFKRDRLVSYLDAMNRAITHGMRSWRPQEGFELFEATKTLTLDIATEVFVGAEPGRDADRLNEAFVHTVHGGQTVVRRDVPGGRWHKGLQSRRELQEYFRGQIPAKRAGEGEDLFSVLCHAEGDDGETFSDEDVVNHMIFVLMAAHDTSTITFSMLAYYLAKHPEWQDRLRAESEALGKDVIDHDDLDALPSMDLAFKETLRMNSPVGNIARQATKDTEINGQLVPAGTNMMVGLYPSMRMEPWWSDPDRFDPERFSEERREDTSHKFAFTPFGGNVHKCIGMHFGGLEVKAILHQLLLGYTWDVPAGYEPAMDYGTGPFPADGLPITLRAR
ncbi:cytochrome P450 [Patulibacter sp.]|uniref:cytochrome P450 n=1 Tax=Patulibacter sp. TaxID=1912859 RepID=UPI002722B184|nr:cytochrome P450 [Patulibacter sp.]MDO9407962.1 cytochrome P450 [Patulibacter sp.]